jgi:hypothetical protein
VSYIWATGQVLPTVTDISIPSVYRLSGIWYASNKPITVETGVPVDARVPIKLGEGTGVYVRFPGSKSLIDGTKVNITLELIIIHFTCTVSVSFPPVSYYTIEGSNGTTYTWSTSTLENNLKDLTLTPHGSSKCKTETDCPLLYSVTSSGCATTTGFAQYYPGYPINLIMRAPSSDATMLQSSLQRSLTNCGSLKRETLSDTITPQVYSCETTPRFSSLPSVTFTPLPTSSGARVSAILSGLLPTNTTAAILNGWSVNKTWSIQPQDQRLPPQQYVLRVKGLSKCHSFLLMPCFMCCHH